MTFRIFMIDDYVLRYDYERQRPWIIINYTTDGKKNTVNLYPPPENAVYIADILRNERPVYWSPEGKYLTTSREMVGEEET